MHLCIYLHAYMRPFIHTYEQQVTEAAEYFNAERVMAMGQPRRLIQSVSLRGSVILVFRVVGSG